jgi:hypothetical protein
MADRSSVLASQSPGKGESEIVYDSKWNASGIGHQEIAPDIIVLQGRQVYVECLKTDLCEY